MKVAQARRESAEEERSQRQEAERKARREAAQQRALQQREARESAERQREPARVANARAAYRARIHSGVARFSLVFGQCAWPLIFRLTQASRPSAAAGPVVSVGRVGHPSAVGPGNRAVPRSWRTNRGVICFDENIMSSSGKRLTLVQRQQMLLEERGFSKPKTTTSFAQRQDAHLQKTGRTNAVGASRKKAEVLIDNEDEVDQGDDAVSVFSRYSHAPSLHPSMAGSMMSEACHPETIGAGDDTQYWDFQHRAVEKHDLGHRCRECRQRGDIVSVWPVGTESLNLFMHRLRLV